MIKPYTTEIDPTCGISEELLSTPWIGSKSVDDISLMDRVWYAKYLESKNRRIKRKTIHPTARLWTNPAWGTRNYY